MNSHMLNRCPAKLVKHFSETSLTRFFSIGAIKMVRQFFLFHLNFHTLDKVDYVTISVSLVFCIG